ncbi:helix-turn-helix domain-containing protein [Chryseobacterium sp. D764]|uniref:helix-turn-helix domain-containing protein n=1 Tax=unclassified Chryseobacterium TaxID=2593645 RepID=UPI00214CBD4E|nr:helix-turn-helix transcriptional regulator [Chryseobacterium sp. D764]
MINPKITWFLFPNKLYCPFLYFFSLNSFSIFCNSSSVKNPVIKGLFGVLILKFFKGWSFLFPADCKYSKGRYEREEVKPSIEVATQLAEALEISLDYLVGATDVLLEKNIVSKILDIQKLKENDKQHVFALLDAFLKQTKLQSIM